ncbi:O-methyltransferase [Candidatus Pantoea formicae]|uniref:O-methyltransferase n=1 Tax=Candidatus Pantoea formicae TaxID=2608355 RepID=UPI003ED9B084
MRTPDYPSQHAEQWAQVDHYFADALAAEDVALKAALAHNAAQGLPIHDVSALQGKMLALMVTLTGAKRVLEIGTLGGYSTIWMARALPEQGQIISLEFNPHHAEVARHNLALARVQDRAEVLVGAALDTLPMLAAPFDLIFIDADKVNNPHYLQWALKLARIGTVIIADNVVRGGAVVEADNNDANVRGLREFVQMISDDARLEATALQTVGEKGWDGLIMAVVKSL